MNNDVFLQRLIAARKAAWWVFLIGVALQMLIYLGYLGIGQGMLDDMIEAGVYGNLTARQLELATFAFLAAQKLINTTILLGAIFLSLWARGLQKQSAISGQS